MDKYFITVFIVAICFITCQAGKCFLASPKFPSILIFGDSTVDTGNNNYVRTVFRADFPPYGQDFPGKTASGRFSNGKLIPDMVASELGIKQTVPPYLDPGLSDDDVITGVSFGSGGSGYDELTTAASNVIPMSKQLEMFREYITRLEGIVGNRKAKEMIKIALVIISAGTNDFIFNYYDLPTRRFEFKEISGYHKFIQTRIQSFVKELYSLGCRKMVVAGLPPIGCLPIQMTAKFQNPNHRFCLEDQNRDAVQYNQKLQKLLSEMEASLPGSKILYSNIYDPIMNLIQNPHKYGFSETKRGCCGTGLLEASFLCNGLTPTCQNHSEFLFWDSIHPTHAAYQQLATILLNDILHKLFVYRFCERRQYF